MPGRNTCHFLSSVHSYCKYSPEETKQAPPLWGWWIIPSDPQGLAAQAAATGPTDNTVRPRTTTCKSPPIVWSSQFVKGLDLIIWNGPARCCQRWEPLLATANPWTSSLQQQGWPESFLPRCVQETLLEGCLGLKGKGNEQVKNHQGSAPGREDLLLNKRRRKQPPAPDW